MVCIDGQPFSIVKNKGFKGHVKHLEPRFSMPSRKHLAKEIIPTMYTEVMGRIKEELHNVKFVGITADIWTSISCDDYLSLTILYLVTDFCLHHCCLEVVQFSEVATQDNGRNIRASLEMSSFEHIPCLARNFHLVSKDGLLGSIIATNLFLRVGDWQGILSILHVTQILKKCQMTTTVPLHRLVQNELTRWNSSLDMLKTLQEQKRAILIVGWEFDLPELRRQQWTLIDNLIPVFNIFDSAMLQVSSTNVTPSEVSATN
ncbi:hypothetical protein PR048_013542 [Dryococelus australis]|uniref:Zinc finger BED domain-containing protein 4 n=1 Tax=Dryococelus australis TaxID=614101 RepID=A0ABQ9HSG3_9NEOP|nr:hypothetical protein PR048_013542 [Dryococelus australis]